MARIRSVHPGLWTDEAFVCLSPFARLLAIGIWNECDDMGSFEWSPLKLKMRLLPADTADVGELLDELLTAGQIMRYDHAGKTYGAVRNFCQYQRPKKPNTTYPQTAEVEKWVNVSARLVRDGTDQGEPEKRHSGELTPRSTARSSEPKARKRGSSSELTPPSSGASSEPVGNQLPTGGEKSRQMEDGGGRRSSVANATGASPPEIDPVKMIFDTGVALLTGAGLTSRAARALIAKWRQERGDGWTQEAIASAAGKSDPVAWIERRKAPATAVADEAEAVSRATAQRYREMNIPTREDWLRAQQDQGETV